MKKLLLILLCLPMIGFGQKTFVTDDNFEKINTLKTLQFPSISTFADSVLYLGCENILSITPPSFNFEIYEDTTINLYQFDDRMNLSLKFNWLYENYWNIGVTSIDILNKESVISNIDLKEIIELEAFMQMDPESKRFEDPVRDDIYMEDVNLDSYLDIKVRSSCGKACYYSYWIFNPIMNTFEREGYFDILRPYYYDCKNNLIYSYPGGTAWYHHIYAYKVTNGGLELFQSVYYEYNEKYYIEIYSDSKGGTILSDTIYYD